LPGGATKLKTIILGLILTATGWATLINECSGLENGEWYEASGSACADVDYGRINLFKGLGSGYSVAQFALGFTQNYTITGGTGKGYAAFYALNTWTWIGHNEGDRTQLGQLNLRYVDFWEWFGGPIEPLAADLTNWDIKPNFTFGQPFTFSFLGKPSQSSDGGGFQRGEFAIIALAVWDEGMNLRGVFNGEDLIGRENNTLNVAALPGDVPEPSTILLSLSGLALVARKRITAEAKSALLRCRTRSY
jgi:hypothetical protein